ncbi:low-specificity L-threonine aldolase [Brevibacillus composti]|uniref:Low-specificity L-threonine aldolase n=1 Tax=Brevibacillus composti TaxID=2796470 RepID=A0A7T5EPB0_9BACL|nr:low-specificity L-threonine aldolase [Brevibacillus composti]QQE76253.1 low-specificity L-threonine aldolase [Brevibacillus composti]QUO43281.1 low-specificity L-threonine aldolase [Brevibacillus composti]
MPIDFRSDTVTKPTEEMKRAMLEAEVGDDVYGEDPTVNRLEKLAAEILGKEAALFVTSGTQGNQLAVLTHCVNGDEVIMEADSHIFYSEGGAVAALAGVQTRTINGERGVITPEAIARAVRSRNIHFPRTRLLCMENTHNRAGGAVISPEQMKAAYEAAHSRGVAVHLDGARLFNAAVALKREISDFTRYADTVQVCLSKGLSAPIGSVLAGSRDFIEEARWWRKKLGGGMRQAGYIAAPGILALTEMVPRLEEDHHRAKRLAEGLRQLSLTVEPVETNIVLVHTERAGMNAVQFLEQLAERGVLAVDFDESLVRFTTHRHITDQDIQAALTAVEAILPA